MAPPTLGRLRERIAALGRGRSAERIDLLLGDLARERAGVRAELTGIHGRLDSTEARLDATGTDLGRVNAALRDLIEQTGDVIARNRELAAQIGDLTVQLRVVESSLAGSASLARKLRRELAPADEGAPEGDENADPVPGA